MKGHMRSLVKSQINRQKTGFKVKSVCYNNDGRQDEDNLYVKINQIPMQ